MALSSALEHFCISSLPPLSGDVPAQLGLGPDAENGDVQLPASQPWLDPHQGGEDAVPGLVAGDGGP